jgi:hypothetical protein
MRSLMLAFIISALACCTPQTVPVVVVPPDATDASRDVPDASADIQAMDASPVAKDVDSVDVATQDAPPECAPDPASQACCHLTDLGCPLGSKATCRAVFELDPKWGIKPECVLRAKSPADLAACHVTCR